MDNEVHNNSELEAIVDSLSGLNTPDVQERLVNWVEKDRDKNIEILKQYKTAWYIFNKRETRFNKSEAWNNVEKKYFISGASEKGVWKDLFLKSAAMVIVAIMSITSYHYYVKFSTEKNLFTVSTQKGNRSESVLPDGTIVKLNADTKINYKKDGNKRVVNISGEAYFKVSESVVPFYVNSGNYQIKVYGTEFNVEAYPDDKFVKTILKEGKVSIKILNDKKPREHFMKPGQMSIYNKKRGVIRFRSYNTSNEIPWIEDKLILRNVNFVVLAKRLNRLYDINIEFADEELRSFHFTGSFVKETPEEIIRTICKISKLSCKRNGRRYLLFKSDKSEMIN